MTIAVTYVLFRTFTGAFNVDLSLEAVCHRTAEHRVLVALTMKKGMASGLLIHSIHARFRPIGSTTPGWVAVDPEAHREATLTALHTPAPANAETSFALPAPPSITISPGETYNLAFEVDVPAAEAVGVLDILVIAQRAPVRMGTPSQWRVSIPLPPRLKPAV